jgi:hypothetical protein
MPTDWHALAIAGHNGRTGDKWRIRAGTSAPGNLRSAVPTSIVASSGAVAGVVGNVDEGVDNADGVGVTIGNVSEDLGSVTFRFPTLATGNSVATIADGCVLRFKAIPQFVDHPGDKTTIRVTLKHNGTTVSFADFLLGGEDLIAQQEFTWSASSWDATGSAFEVMFSNPNLSSWLIDCLDLVYEKTSDLTATFDSGWIDLREVLTTGFNDYQSESLSTRLVSNTAVFRNLVDGEPSLVTGKFGRIDFRIFNNPENTFKVGRLLGGPAFWKIRVEPENFEAVIVDTSKVVEGQDGSVWIQAGATYREINCTVKGGALEVMATVWDALFRRVSSLSPMILSIAPTDTQIGEALTMVARLAPEERRIMRPNLSYDTDGAGAVFTFDVRFTEMR